MRLPVNELFETIQGEGSQTGTPAVFVRLQGCPVGCPWCDTKYTWVLDEAAEVANDDIRAKTGADGKAASWSYYELSDLVSEIVRFRARHVVITGGEPCLYDLVPLTRALCDTGRSVQIETSGTHRICADNRTWITVSPKVDMPGGFRVRSDALALADEIKMPVGSADDVQALLTLLDQGLHRAATRVYLQPLSLSAKATSLCIDQATEHGFRVSLQVHALAGWR